MTSPSARSGGLARRLPEATVVRRELGRGAEDRGGRAIQGKVEEIFWEAGTQARAELAGVPRK